MCNVNILNLSSNDPAYQYQVQKIIQKTVRVPSSLYTMNLGSLSTYQSPLSSIKVNWNQSSDRRDPHIQSNSGRSQGSFYHGSSLRHSQTRERPGATSPGGVGVDIKHNSYNRYMNRLKAPYLKRGPVPTSFGVPIPFNPAFPVYGGKTMKTSIINNCNCDDNVNNNIYNVNDKANLSGDGSYIYVVGDYVYCQKSVNKPFFKAKIIHILDGLYTILFIHDNTTIIVGYSSLIPYFNCENCNLTTVNGMTIDLSIVIGESDNGSQANSCTLLNLYTGPDAVPYILNLLKYTVI